MDFPQDVEKAFFSTMVAPTALKEANEKESSWEDKAPLGTRALIVWKGLKGSNERIPFSDAFLKAFLRDPILET